MRIIIHIGSQKTGSTALQTMLADNAEALRDLGINYVQAGRKNIAHNAVAQDLRHGDATAQFDEMAAEVAALPDHTHIMSSEMFFHQSLAGRLQAVLHPDLHPSVQLVCYLRPHDRYLEAMYKQLLKNGKIGANPGAFLKRRLKSVGYGPVLDAFSDSFGTANLDVRAFDPAGFAGGDIRADFAQLAGFDPGMLPKVLTVPSNRTLSAEISEILGEISQNTAMNTRPIIRRIIDMPDAGQFRSCDVFTADEHAQIVAQCAADRAYVRDRYCPEFGRTDTPPENPPATAEERLERYRSALRIVTRAMKRPGT